jgi:hypothetical protein
MDRVHPQAANPWPAYWPPEGWPASGRILYYQLLLISVMLFLNMVCLTVALAVNIICNNAKGIFQRCQTYSETA